MTNKHTIMLIHTESNTIFDNRKQAIKCMGRYKYNKELRLRHFKFDNNEDLDCEL